MRMTSNSLILFGGLTVLGLAGCLSLNDGLKQGSNHQSFKRRPAAEYAQDAFSAKGYQEATHRNMQEGKTLPDEQITKEMAGREIWYKSAPNGRMHTYVFSQRVNAPIDWYKVLRSDQRPHRFNTWGMINDPDCCTPGDDCEKKGLTTSGKAKNGARIDLESTYGFDFCDGDETLLGYVGRSDLNYSAAADPACQSQLVAAADSLDEKNGKLRESSCELAYGTSTGAVGFRKFPNPRFNQARWDQINGWQGYEKREFDGSIEPPFRVAISCASCHASFDPTKPPKNPNFPEWNEISGTVGNQYIQITGILGSGTRKNSLEQQMFTAIARPGTSDTSAVPNDMIGNPGTINAIINIPQRPKFTDSVTRWRQVDSCDERVASCQKVSNKVGKTKYWEWSKQDQEVFHILKGGEDSVGADLAVQRVYVNIGMCAEQCWVNHHLDIRALSPHDRGFQQTPFDIAQCRRDCAPWRANEDRVGDIISFLLSGRPFDLKTALKNTNQISGGSDDEVDAKFIGFLESRYGEGSYEKGKELFANNCATCHSSQNTNKVDGEKGIVPEGTNFHTMITLPSGERIRADWMGNDKSTPVTEVETYQCRSLHTNHSKGHLWEQFASETYRNKPSSKNLRDVRGNEITGGPGYYRNISLLSAWAFAPFLHNNSVGPEVCGKPTPGLPVVHRNTREGQQTNPSTAHSCQGPDDQVFDPSVEGRLKIYEASIDELLTPSSKRKAKIAKTDVPVRLPLGIDFKTIGKNPQKFYLEFGVGTRVADIGNFDIKNLTADIFGSLQYVKSLEANADLPEFRNYWRNKIANGGDEMADAVLGTLRLLKGINIKDIDGTLEGVEDWKNGIREGDNQRLKVYKKYYSTCAPRYPKFGKADEPVENFGHEIGTQLSTEEKNALKAFLATL